MEIKNRHKNILIPPVFVASVLCEVLWLKSSNFFFLINIFELVLIKIYLKGKKLIRKKKNSYYKGTSFLF